jgi:hypothetical protein
VALEFRVEVDGVCVEDVEDEWARGRAAAHNLLDCWPLPIALGA